AELREKPDAGTKAVVEGVELTEREVLKVLEKHGVKKFEPLDEKFDPNLHQAMFELPDASRPAGTVARVIQPGYMIGERILRPALVAVAKGGPKGSMESPANDNAGASQDPRGSHCDTNAPSGPPGRKALNAPRCRRARSGSGDRRLSRRPRARSRSSADRRRRQSAATAPPSTQQCRSGPWHRRGSDGPAGRRSAAAR